MQDIWDYLLLAGTLIFVISFINALFSHPKEYNFEKIFSGLNHSKSPRVGDVKLVYHTYHGFLQCGTHQTEHRVWLPSEDARELLWRLLWFNLTHGIFGIEAVFVPFLAVFNYFSQLKSINRQEFQTAFLVRDPKPGQANGARENEVPQAFQAEVPVAEVPIAEVPVTEVPVTEVPVAEVPVAEKREASRTSKVFAILSVPTFVFQPLGFVFAVVTVILTRKTTGWPKTVGLILILAYLVLLALIVLIILIE